MFPLEVSVVFVCLFVAESVPMASRNLPASFFNAHAMGGAGLGAGGVGGAGAGGGELYEYEWGGWGSGGYGYGSQYAGLLLPRSLQHYKPVEWAPPPLDAPYSYPPVHSQYHHHHHQREYPTNYPHTHTTTRAALAPAPQASNLTPTTQHGQQSSRAYTKADTSLILTIVCCVFAALLLLVYLKGILHHIKTGNGRMR